MTREGVPPAETSASVPPSAPGPAPGPAPGSAAAPGPASGPGAAPHSLPGRGVPAAPTATYRLQLQPEFPFAAAERAVPYLAGLGVSHLHLSPVLTSVPGSRHGYDVTDHGTVREELGGERGLRQLAATAHGHGLGLVVDVVPNHMAVPEDLRLNQPLWQTLRDGPSSPCARWFDIDWEAGGGRVLLPVLGERLHEALPLLRVEDGVLRYGTRVLPLREGTAHLPMDRLCEAQHYRLAWWRLARTELNYRRFFTISDLIAVRVEDPDVFAATHHKLLQLLREGVVDGLRVDHPDGLADPGDHLRRLHAATGGRWTVVEKILSDGEALPRDWPVAGTTGYDALRHLDGLFTDPAGHEQLAVLHRRFTGVPDDRGGRWAETRQRAAHRVVVHDLAAEAERLTRAAARACAASDDLSLRDHAPWALRAALRELLVRLPVYRPYTGAGRPPGAGDAVLLERAAEGAHAAFRVPEEAEAVDAVRKLALGLVDGSADAREFPARFAQLSSALRAKSVEDMAFYRYTPLLSACEVGCEPDRPALGPDDFHACCARLQRDWPASSTALSTHDTKRSGDARAALALLTECPEEWAALLGTAEPPGAAGPADPREPAGAAGPAGTREPAGAEPAGTAGVSGAAGASGAPGNPGTPKAAGSPGAAEAPRGQGAGPRAPDRHTAWTYWQTALALGVFPPPPDRLVPVLLKSVREAGLRTTWTEPDAAYEEAVARYAEEAPHGPGADALRTLADALAPHLRANVLGAALLHLTMPGVPDLYQGTEHVRRTLVDPDNRAPVAFPAADGDGAPGTAGGPGAVPERTALDAEKEALTVTALRLRARHPELFSVAGSYRPLRPQGENARHCVAFVRSGAVLTAVTRLSLRLAARGGWGSTRLTLPDGVWQDALAPHDAPRALRGEQALDSLFARAPVALLVRTGD
ncbi:malto-oligosyltrehalose synthase [Streptomyces sp. NRRL F-5053]|uniref:malto-oligosyltrehalose synthase n=1 Tax=Streptomyces sp. NRRL F-5053 TaxID=1463854 RepID=UPI0007C54B4F|nr:malto-oligosyltrehalose synthase [Streptomyces sp. NRRL F-5053]